eukprot:scaffold3437_cov113-Cylindrotheca_fusiformis.AAC.36
MNRKRNHQLILPTIALWLFAIFRLEHCSTTFAFGHNAASGPRAWSQQQEVTNDVKSSHSLDSPTVSVAIEAVRKACRVTTDLQEKMDAIATLIKDDKSPVTVGDFACQAVVLQYLEECLPNSVSKTFLAEEKSSNLTPNLTKQILEAVKEESIEDEDTLRDCIDLGQSFYENGSPTTFWCLDPIDGTKGFLRREQYCIALGLLEDGIPTVGILGCPNLPFDDDGTIGCIFVACKDRGCYQFDLFGLKPPKRIGMGYNPQSPPPVDQSRFCIGVEQGFGDPDGNAKRMAKELHGELSESTGDIVHAVRMDSQAKYGVVARGDAEFYVRLPKSEYQEWIWDVAPGILVLEEAGGKVSDANGVPLDFSTGAKLTGNYGVLGACCEPLYRSLVRSYNVVTSSSDNGS